MIKKLHSSRGRKLRYIKLLFTIEQLGLKDSMNAMALYKAAGKKARDTTIIEMCSNPKKNESNNCWHILIIRFQLQETDKISKMHNKKLTHNF